VIQLPHPACGEIGEVYDKLEKDILDGMMSCHSASSPGSSVRTLNYASKKKKRSTSWMSV
jgi:hypothetical protein